MMPPATAAPPPMPWRARPWWPAAVSLSAATGALTIALLVPVVFSDPNGVDPYAIRLAGVALLLLGVAWRVPGLAAARPTFLAIAAFTVPFSIWLGTPRLLVDVMGRAAPAGWAQIFWASAFQGVAAVGFCLLARCLPEPQRGDLRLGVTPLAVAVALAGLAMFALVWLAIPAEILGRVAISPGAIARDAIWLVPADILQGAVQELQFRGLLMGTLERVMKPRVANLLQALVFGFGHLAFVYQGPEAPFVPLTVLLGLVLGYATQRCRSLWPAIVVHAAADVILDVTVVRGLYGA